MTPSLWISLAAVLISAGALLLSYRLTKQQLLLARDSAEVAHDSAKLAREATEIASRQIRLSRQALQVQPFFNFMLDFRDPKYHNDFNYVVNNLHEEHPPSSDLGLYDLPE